MNTWLQQDTQHTLRILKQWAVMVPQWIGLRKFNIRDAELLPLIWMLPNTAPQAEEPLPIDARAEWHVTQRLHGEINRQFLKRTNLAFINRIRCILNRRGRHPWGPDHPWWRELRQRWEAQVLNDQTIKWEVAPWLIGQRPLLWLTSHQDRKIRDQ